MTEPLPGFKRDPWRILCEAIVEHEPRKIFALFSGGHDSTVLVAWARMRIGHLLDAAVFIDTGTALPGVREFVEDYCKPRRIPLLVYEAGDEYERMVREHGFPGPAAHRFAYVRLKERQVDALVRDHKTGSSDRIMLLTGVRRAESTRRMGTTHAIRRDGAQVWVAPLIDWTNDDMRDFRAEHELPESDAAALVHRSGECNCGAFAAAGEREQLRSLWPEWFEEHIAPLEAATGARWGDRPREQLRSLWPDWFAERIAPLETATGTCWGDGPAEQAVEAGPLCSSCDVAQMRLEEAT